MDLKSLKIFVHVSDLGSLTKAAIDLGVTQPTLSRSIVQLEEEFGGPLFYRTGRGVVLTDIGIAALPLARSLVAHADDVLTEICEHGRSPTGKISMGILPSMAHPITSRLFDLVRKQLPGIRLQIYEGFSDQIDQWLASGHVDLGLLSRYRAIRPQQDEIMFNSGLLLVGPPSNQAVPDIIDFKQLVDLPLVLPMSPNGLRLLVDETAKRLGMTLNVALEADSLGTQKDVIQNYGCYSVLSPQAVYKEMQAGSISASVIINPSLSRTAILTSTTQRPLSRTGLQVMKLTHQIIDDLRDDMGW